jgi:hypothetical protein
MNRLNQAIQQIDESYPNDVQEKLYVLENEELRKLMIRMSKALTYIIDKKISKNDLSNPKDVQQLKYVGGSSSPARYPSEHAKSHDLLTQECKNSLKQESNLQQDFLKLKD